MAKGKMITEADLLFDQDPRIEQQGIAGFDIEEKIGTLPLKSIVAEFEASIIHRALDKFKGNVSTAADQLKLGKTALYDKMKQHNISAKHIKQVKKNR
jgi:DNA-binding NtrC family response regulator